MYKVTHKEGRETTFTTCYDYYRDREFVVLCLNDENGMPIEKSIHKKDIIEIEEI